MNSNFIENVEQYKKLMGKNYRAPSILYNLDLLVNFTPTIIFLFLFCLNPTTIVASLVLVSMAFFMIISGLMVETNLKGYFVSKKDKMYKLKKILRREIFNESLFDIFDKECEITLNVLKKNKILLREQLLINKGYLGYTILRMLNEIYQEKVKCQEIAVMVECNTKTGKLFKEIQEL